METVQSLKSEFDLFGYCRDDLYGSMKVINLTWVLKGIGNWVQSWRVSLL